MIINMTGGGDNTVIDSITITENGTYTAPSGMAYGDITVDVQPEYSFNGGVEYTHQLAPNATVVRGDFCYYGPVSIGSGLAYYVYPLDYDTGGALGSSRITCIAKETKTAGPIGYRTDIAVYQPT